MLVKSKSLPFYFITYSSLLQEFNIGTWSTRGGANERASAAPWWRGARADALMDVRNALRDASPKFTLQSSSHTHFVHRVECAFVAERSRKRALSPFLHRIARAAAVANLAAAPDLIVARLPKQQQDGHHWARDANQHISLHDSAECAVYLRMQAEDKCEAEHIHPRLLPMQPLFHFESDDGRIPILISRWTSESANRWCNRRRGKAAKSN